MLVMDAVRTVLELAEQNILSDEQVSNDDKLFQEQQKQLEAVNTVKKYFNIFS